jgi:hypothetical protein
MDNAAISAHLNSVEFLSRGFIVAGGHGGARPGAGRKRRGQNQKTREIADRARENGVTPLEFLLSVMRDPTVESHRRESAAQALLPYMHPRMPAAASYRSVPDGSMLVTNICVVSVAQGHRDDGAPFEFGKATPRLVSPVTEAVEITAIDDGESESPVPDPPADVA